MKAGKWGYTGSVEGLFEYLDSQIECSICMDTGEVATMSQVYPGEPHMMADTAPCPHLRKE